MEEILKRLDQQDEKIKKLQESLDKLIGKKDNDGGNVSIIKYKKSIVVTGNTKPIKDTMKEYHGRWNTRLKDEDGKTFCGWVFDTSHSQDLIDSIKEEGIEPIVLI